MSRYDAEAEDEFERGSEGRVLRNRLGIVDPKVAGRIEASLLADCYERRLRRVSLSLVLDQYALIDLHKDWLGPLYPFAGTLRTVNVSKDGFLFAPVPYLSKGLEGLDRSFRRRMPCSALPLDDLCAAIAEIHTEIIFLHPFREGNGRLGRLVADLMAAQAGYGTLRWGFGRQGQRGRYFAALRQGFVTNYSPLAVLVQEALLAAGRRVPPR